MQKELQDAINSTANMRDRFGKWIRLGTFMYDNRKYGFLKEGGIISVRCIELAPDGNMHNMYPNMEAEWKHETSRDEMSDEEFKDYMLNRRDKNKIIITKIS